jgi:RNA polymerase sigma-70 factor, ECF subfamily
LEFSIKASSDFPTMKITNANTAGERTVLKGMGMRPRRMTVIDDAAAQARRRSVLATDFEALYELYQRRVFMWCLRVVRNMDDAEDLRQDVFLVLFRKIDTYRGQSAFSTWLYRLATNVALMRVRRKVLPQTSVDEILETYEGAINPRMELKNSDRAQTALATRVDLQRMFEQMPSGYRKALFLHDSEEYTHPEISVMTGCSIGTSKSQLHKARQRFRLLLERGAAKEKPVSTLRRRHTGRKTKQSSHLEPTDIQERSM